MDGRKKTQETQKLGRIRERINSNSETRIPESNPNVQMTK